MNDIKILDNREKGREDQEHQFVRDLITKEENVSEQTSQNLTIDERLELLQLKNKTMEHLSKSKTSEDTELMKLESSLAFTEDEIYERIE